MTDPKPPSLIDPLDDLLGYQMRRASLASFSDLTIAFEQLELRPTEAIIIRFVQANPGCNQAEIGRALGVQRTNMVPLVAGLVDGGMIAREVADGRTNALHLTADGAALHERIAQATADNEQKYYGDFDDATKAVLRDAFRAIRAKG